MSWSLQYLPRSVIVYLKFFWTNIQTPPLFTTCLQYFLFVYLGMQLLKKYPAFHGTSRLIAANGRIGKSTPLVPPLTQMNPFHYVFQLWSMWIFISHLYQRLPRVSNTCWHWPGCLYRCMKNTIKLHVQVFLMMDTWFFETCQRQYNWIKLMKKVCILLVLFTYVYHNAHFKKP